MNRKKFDIKKVEVGQLSGKAVTWTNNKKVEGLFAGSKEKVGENKQTIYFIDTEKEGSVGVWETFQIRTFFEEAKPAVGDFVSITYKGEKKIGNKQTLKEFEFEHGTPN